MIQKRPANFAPLRLAEMNSAIIFHAKNRLIAWRAVLPAALAGCATAALGAFVAVGLEMAVLQKLFGGFLLLVGLEEVILKGILQK